MARERRGWERGSHDGRLWAGAAAEAERESSLCCNLQSGDEYFDESSSARGLPLARRSPPPPRSAHRSARVSESRPVPQDTPMNAAIDL